MNTVIDGFYCIVLLSIISTVNSQEFSNYGPFEVNWLRYEACRGPKAKNMTQWSTNLYKKGNSNYIRFNFSFPAQTSLDETKMLFYLLKNDTKNLLWVQKLTSPCKHFAFGTIINTFLKTHNCIISKGDYYINLNIDEISNNFLGKSAFYGDFMVKSNTMSKRGNIFCVLVIYRISKKTKVKD